MIVTPATLPLADPQFWIVTLVALCAAAWLLRKLLPAVLGRKHRKRGSTRATLTVGGNPVDSGPKQKCH